MFDKKRYSKQWPTIRQRILDRAKNRCERCGARQYSVGWRDAQGRFHVTGGNEWHDKAAMGELPYAEALAGVKHLNECCDGLGPNGERGIVIVLTCAHLNHRTRDTRLSVIRAYCQKCHLDYDRDMHSRVARRNREAKRLAVQPRLPLEER
jgi:hypothetical protein